MHDTPHIFDPEFVFIEQRLRFQGSRPVLSLGQHRFFFPNQLRYQPWPCKRFHQVIFVAFTCSSIITNSVTNEKRNLRINYLFKGSKQPRELDHRIPFLAVPFALLVCERSRIGPFIQGQCVFERKPASNGTDLH